jgi:hypothetical protein
MVVVLLNLAFIPDRIVRSTKMDPFNFEPGWQYNFKARMQRYKDYFNTKMG